MADQRGEAIRSQGPIGRIVQMFGVSVWAIQDNASRSTQHYYYHTCVLTTCKHSEHKSTSSGSNTSKKKEKKMTVLAVSRKDRSLGYGLEYPSIF